MTEFLEIAGGRIAYDVAGAGPLVVLAPGMGKRRDDYRFLAPWLIEAGYRVASADLRGHGESSTGWTSYTRTDTAGDLLALIRHLGGPAVIAGNSFSGGSATIAAAREPGLVSAVAELGPFTRVSKLSLAAMLTNSRYRKGSMLLARTGMTGSLRAWSRYLDHAFPGVRPADYAVNLAALQDNLREPGRMAAARKMGLARPTDAGACLPDLRRPAVVIMGTLDPDWPDPEAEANRIVAEMPAGIGSAAMIEGAGHYPHVQFPDQTAAVLLPFLREHAQERASA